MSGFWKGGMCDSVTWNGIFQYLTNRITNNVCKVISYVMKWGAKVVTRILRPAVSIHRFVSLITVIIAVYVLETC